MVIVTRKMRGQAASIGGKDHLSHRLVTLGFNERTSAAVLCMAAIGSAFLATQLYKHNSISWLSLTVIYWLVLLIGIVWLVRKTPIATELN